MKIRPLGISDAFSRSGRGFPHFVLEHKKRYALVDVGPDIIERLFELGIMVTDIEEIFITHYHDDHVGGLNRLLELRRCIARDPKWFALGGYCKEYPIIRPLKITCPNIDTQIHEFILASVFRDNKVGDEVEVIEYNAQVGMLTGIFDKWVKVLMFPVKHSVPCCGIKFDDAVAISADTMFDSRVEDHLSSASLIFHECGSGGPHTKIEELATLPDEVKSKMRLYHVPDPYLDWWENSPPAIAVAKRDWYELE